MGKCEISEILFEQPEDSTGFTEAEGNIMLFTMLMAFVMGVVFVLNNPHGHN